ncbi:unnamed protein product [Arctogadus glacialis]
MAGSRNGAGPKSGQNPGQLSSPLNPAPTSQQRLERGREPGGGVRGAGGRSTDRGQACGGMGVQEAGVDVFYWEPWQRRVSGFGRKQCLRFMPGKQPPTTATHVASSLGGEYDNPWPHSWGYQPRMSLDTHLHTVFT